MSIPCPSCNKLYKDKRGLAVHQAKCGIEKEVKHFVCEHCNLELKNNDNLQRHYIACKSLKEKQHQQYTQQQLQPYIERIKTLEQERDKLQEYVSFLRKDFEQQLSLLHKEYEQRLLKDRLTYIEYSLFSKSK